MLIITVWLLIISIMDVRSRRIPVWMLAVGGVCVVLILIYQFRSNVKDYAQILRGAIPGILLLTFGVATKKTGYGDGIALLLAGMVLGDGRIYLLFGVSLFLISVYSLVLLTLKKAGRSTKIPYLPFLTAAWLLVMDGFL